MKNVVVQITPVTVYTQEQLRDAIGEKQTAIIITGDSLFNEVEQKIGKTKAVKTAKKVGNIATVGAIVLAPFAGIAAVAGANIVAHLVDKFKKYAFYVDYSSHSMVLLDKSYAKAYAKDKSQYNLGEQAETIIQNSTVAFL